MKPRFFFTDTRRQVISLFIVCALCSKEFHFQVGVELKIVEVKLHQSLDGWYLDIQVFSTGSSHEPCRSGAPCFGRENDAANLGSILPP